MGTASVRVKDGWVHHGICYLPSDHDGMHMDRSGYVLWGSSYRPLSASADGSGRVGDGIRQPDVEETA